MSSSTTTRTTKTEYDDSLSAVSYSYKSHIAPRSTTISRRNAGPGRTIVQTVYSSQSGGFGQQNAGGFLYGGGVPLKPKNAAVVAIAENREKEKKEN